MDASDSAQVTRPFVAAIAAPHPAIASLHSLPLGPRLVQAPATGSPCSLPFGPTLLKALPPTRLTTLSLVHVTTKTPPRHRHTALPSATTSSKTKTPRGTASRRSRRPPPCPRPRLRHGITSRRSRQPPLCTRPRPRRNIASRCSCRPPRCPRPRPRRGTASRAPTGHLFVQDQDPAATSPRRGPVGPCIAQDLAVNSPCRVSVGHISTSDHIDESPSSSEKAAVVTGVPPGLACRPPVVSPSSTSGVSVPISPRTSSGLISSRNRNHSAAAAGTPRTPADYGFGRRSSATAASRPTSPQRRPPTLGSKPAAQRPATTQRRAIHNTSSPSTATSSTTPQPDPPHHPRPPTQGPLPRPPLLCWHHLDYRNTLSSPLMPPISVPASSTTITPTGRANNALSPSAPPPSGSSPWIHLRRHRTTSWTTSPRLVVHLLPRSYPSPQKASYTPLTTTPFFSYTDHTRIQPAMPAIYTTTP